MHEEIDRKVTRVPKGEYRPEIDGLRALAVLSVIIYHLDKAILPEGFLGVDIFFVISGYVITKTLYQDKSAGLASFLANFYARRIKRILPALILVVAFSSVCFAFVSTWDYLSTAIKTGFTALFGFSNLYLFQRNVDYWGGSSELNPFTQTWSLGVEEQFYLVFPLFLWIAGIRNEGKSKGISRSGAVILVSLTAVSMGAFLYMFERAPLWVFYLTPYRFWEISVGALLYIHETSRTHTRAGVIADEPDVRNLEHKMVADSGDFVSTKTGIFRRNLLRKEIAPLCYLVPLVATLAVPATYLAQPYRTVLAVAATAFLINSFGSQSSVKRFFSLTPIVYLGKISYSLYLWHWIVIVFFRWMSKATLVAIPIQMLIGILIAILSYEFVEKKFRYQSWSRNSFSTIVRGFVISGAVGCLLFSLALVAKSASDSSSPWTGLREIHIDHPCHMPTWSKDPIADCLKPLNLDLRTIYIVGNSHSTNLVPSVIEAANGKYEVRYLADAALLISMLRTNRAKVQDLCGGTVCSNDEFQSRLDFFDQFVRKGDIVIFATSRDILFDDDFRQGSRRVPVPERIGELKSSLVALGLKIASRGGRLDLIDGLPKVCSHQAYAIGKALRPENPCQGSRDASLADRAPLSEIYREVSRVTGAKVIDPHPYLCAGEICESSLKGRLLSWDGSPHFLNSFPNPLTQMFIEHLFEGSGM